MSGEQIEAPCGWGADTGQEGHKANAAGTCKIAQSTGRAKRGSLYRVTLETGEAFTIEATHVADFHRRGVQVAPEGQHASDARSLFRRL